MNKRELQKIIGKLVGLSFKEGKIMESQVGKSIRLLKALPKSEAILALSGYLKELKRVERQHTMYIEAAINLSPTQINKIKKIVDQKVNITKVSVNINPEVLGGFRLRIGDEIWDESLAGKIQQVKEAIRG